MLSYLAINLNKNKVMENWQKIFQLGSINSTNIYTSDLLKTKVLGEGTIISTLFQTDGKGLGKNSWESEKGKNILLSIVLYPTFLQIENQFLLSKAISLGIANYCYTKSNYIKIKWPNDIYYNDKKLAGILIENSVKGSVIEKSIAGIGLNVNQEIFVSDAPNPVSLKQITKKNYLIEQEIIKLRNNIQFFYEKLKAGNIKSIDKEYLKCLYQFGEYKKYKSGDKIFEGKITGVNEFGHLQMLTKEGEKKEFDLKEIEFIL